jgi:NitT/TauT family transport system substrate-binding protein
MKKKVLWMAVCVLLSAASAAGCGNTPDSGETQGSASPAELEKLTVQSLWLPQGQFAGLYVAKAKGYYEEEGLDVEILPGGTDVTSEDQVANGVAQVGVAFYSSVLTYQEGGYDLVNVFQTFQKSPQWLITKKDSGVTDGGGLRGKKVGSWFGGRQYEFYALARKYGMDPDNDIEWVQQDYTMDQFYSGQIDAASAMSYNEYLLVLDDGYSPDDLNIIDMNDEGVALLEDCLFVKRSWAEENADLLARFLRATIKGWQQAIENPQEAGQIVFDEGQSASLEHQVRMTEAVAGFVLPDGSSGQIGALDRGKIQQTIDLGLESGLIQSAIDIDDSIDASYWEAAYAGL